MSKIVRLFLTVVLTVNAAGAAALLLGELPSAYALSESGAESETTAPPHDGDALRLLGEQLAQRSEQLQRQEAEIEELLRSEELLKRAEIVVEDIPAEPAEEQAQVAAEAEPAAESGDGFAFQKLQRAYENMEAESAALALAELASLDQEAVVQLLISWPPRTSGAILDALTQADPLLAAKLSYEIWKKGGNNVATAATVGR